MDIKERRKIIKNWMAQSDQHDQEVARLAKIRDEAYKLYRRDEINSLELDLIWHRYRYPEPPTCPPELRNMRCGAKNRKGQPCANRNIYANGRCKYHGGLSTGPRTLEGKARSAFNLPVSVPKPM